MAPTYETTGTYGQTAGAAPAATITVGVPSGVVADDIVELHIYSDPTGSVITPPAGFAEAPDSPTIIDGSQDQRLSVYWKRATGSESGTYTTTFSTNTFAEASAIRISGCITSGSPYDDTASDTDDTLTTTVTPALSLTTTVGNTLLVHVGANWNGGTWTPSTGFTTRATGGFNLLHVATKAQAATGSTGTVQATCATTNTLTSAWLGALKGPAAGQTVAPTGLAVPVALGAPTVAWSATISPNGIAVPVALGSPVVGAASVNPSGLAVPVALGAPTLTWSGATAPDGIAVPVALGDPSAPWSAVLQPNGIAVLVALGSPSVAVSGAGVTRPSATAVGRPTATAVARPSTTPVPRP